MRAACCEATVLRNEVIAPDIRLLTVVWPDRDHAPHAGQFFTLRAWGADEAPFLSRPISVHRWNPDSSTIEFLYQVVGEGTEKLAQLKQQDAFQLTGPMGNGFDVPEIVSKYKKIAVVGGGIGTAPMYQLTRELAAAGVALTVVLGILVNSMLAYALARFKFAGRNLLLSVIVSLIIIPFEAIAVPLLMLVTDPPGAQAATSIRRNCGTVKRQAARSGAVVAQGFAIHRGVPISVKNGSWKGAIAEFDSLR